MSKITKTILNAFARIASASERKPLQGAFVDPSGALCACDGFMIARLHSCADSPELENVPRATPDPLHTRLLDMLRTAAAQDRTLCASAARASHHGAQPILHLETLRAFARWSTREHGGDAWPIGGTFVSASRLALLLSVVPDACVYEAPGRPLDPLYISGAAADAILLPIRCTTPDQTRARAEEWRAMQAHTASAEAASNRPRLAPAPPLSIRQAVQSTAETSLRVIGYRRDGNTVCVHRVQAHHVADNIYVYSSRADQYGNFAWRFVSLFACGYALELDCLPDNVSYCDDPTSNGHCTEFGGRSLVDFLRALNVVFADDAAFLSCIQACINTNAHIQLSFVRMLQEMGNQDELIARVMAYRQQRAKAIEKAESEKAAARIEAEQQEEQQRQQQHAQALADCRAALLSDGACKPVDGAILCDLAASIGVPVSLKLKGWIMNKLATVTIEDGKMCMYQYHRQKQTEKGSAAFWGWMNKLLDALHAQEQQAETSDTAASADDMTQLFGNAPKPENQPPNLTDAPEIAQTSCANAQQPKSTQTADQPNGHVLPATIQRAQQITMNDLFNTS